jgi:hypothetical protein
LLQRNRSLSHGVGHLQDIFLENVLLRGEGLCNNSSILQPSDLSTDSTSLNLSPAIQVAVPKTPGSRAATRVLPHKRVGQQDYPSSHLVRVWTDPELGSLQLVFVFSKSRLPRQLTTSQIVSQLWPLSIDAVTCFDTFRLSTLLNMLVLLASTTCCHRQPPPLGYSHDTTFTR